MPPRVLVVVEQLRRKVPGGIGTYARGLLQGLRALRDDGELLPAVELYASRAPGAAADGVDPLASLAFPLRTVPVPGAALTRAWSLALLRAPAGFDVVHAVSLAAPPTRCGAVEVVAVHDFAWRRFPEAYNARGRRWHDAALARAVRRADAFVVPSAEVAGELQGEDVPATSVHVVPYGTDHLAQPDDDAADDLLARLGVRGPFLLSVGTLEPRKNLVRLGAAYARIRDALPEPWPLVVVGPRGWGDVRVDGPGVLLAGPVEPGCLSALYARALLLAYVPLEEGYGLPVVEAMALGTPVLSSPVPSAAGATLEVDPSDVDSVAQGLLSLANDESLRGELAAAGAARAVSLTWSACARTHLALWKSFS